MQVVARRSGTPTAPGGSLAGRIPTEDGRGMLLDRDDRYEVARDLDWSLSYVEPRADRGTAAAESPWRSLLDETALQTQTAE